MVKSWLVQDQTVLGKDYSNLLIADSLLKTIWFINAPCYGNEALASPKANELAIPEQTATGKGKTNPFMAGHRFSPNKTSVVYEKTSPRSDLRWKPTGRIFKSVGLRWIPTGKLFDSCTSKVDSEPPHGSNVDIPNIHECKQTLDSMVAEKADISETIVKVDSQMMIKKMTFKQNGSSLVPQCQQKFIKQLNLKNKTFEDIQALYEKVKRFDESFTAVGSIKDERRIKEMNEGVKDPDQKSLKKRVVEETPKKEDTAKVPAKVDVTEQGTKKRKCGHIKMLARKRKRPQSDVDSDDEHKKCLKIVHLKSLDSEIWRDKYVIARLNKVSSPDGDYLVIYRANGNFRAFNCLLEVLHIFDRQDLFHLFEDNDGLSLHEENDQSDFWEWTTDWEVVTWRLYEACGVYILELKDGKVIRMLVERRYPISKDLLQRILDLGLEVGKEKVYAVT
ncbi:hypothetical protein Tco_0829574 [Tanacetum coccineum]